jgi:hypothetical protein
MKQHKYVPYKPKKRYDEKEAKILGGERCRREDI